MARYASPEYVRFAEQALMELIRQEGAVLVREAEAKISEQRWPSVPTSVDPHHLTTARQHLLQRGWMKLSAPIDASGTQFMQPTDERGKKEAIRTASKRKRRLHGRMEKWARPTSRYPAGLLGEAGERVVRASLDAAALRGMRPVFPGGGEVAGLLGAPVQGGPLDAAAWADQLDEYGRSTGSVLCPIEVKNIRHWLYPIHHELFQLLHKSALLQQANPDEPIHPVLITRKRAWITEQMSRDLGFRVIDLNKQFVLPTEDVDAEHVEEVRRELGYKDLTRSDGADQTLTGILAGSVRTTAQANSKLWLEHGSKLTEHYETLRSTSLSQRERDAAMNELREAADENDSRSRPW
ncbi:MAG TPA: hypothetical protein VHT29_09180 [Solirubrobacteraceae bacterium]|nr:hypothetical protein [Solirubrobacteraceae bacterium]